MSPTTESSMLSRLLSSLAVAAVLSLPAAALAQDAGATNLDCTIATQSQAGSTCAICVVDDADTSCQLQLGGDYNFVCSYNSTQQIWCNGPDREATEDTNATSCSVTPGRFGEPSGAAGSAAVLMVAAALAALSRRRSR